VTTETTAAGLSGETTPVGSTAQISLSETDRSRLYTFLHSGQQSAQAHAYPGPAEIGGWSFIAAIFAAIGPKHLKAALSHLTQSRFYSAVLVAGGIGIEPATGGFGALGGQFPRAPGLPAGLMMVP
jgi:hypothetical protein